ncbi:MAG: helix-turn-helix transcriptional regulator [Micromonosporaceae bacterium]
MPTTVSRMKAGAGPASRTKPARDELLSVPDVLEELDIAKATFYRWRQLGKAPQSIKLPNGQVRIRRSVLNEWLDSLTEDELSAMADGAA